MQLKDDVAIHFNGAPNEMGRMDFRAGLGDVSCPVLVQAGAEDPVTPPAFTDVIAASVPQDLVSYRVYEDAGHGVVQDRPDAMEEIRRFILS